MCSEKKEQGILASFMPPHWFFETVFGSSALLGGAKVIEMFVYSHSNITNIILFIKASILSDLKELT